jgi:epoxyqueuosine reductase
VIVVDVCGIGSIKRFNDAPKGFHPLDVYSETKSVIVFGKQFSASLFEANTNVPYLISSLPENNTNYKYE